MKITIQATQSRTYPYWAVNAEKNLFLVTSPNDGLCIDEGTHLYVGEVDEKVLTPLPVGPEITFNV